MRPTKPPKEKDIDNDLRLARASRKADAQQKHRLRRHDWDSEGEDVENEPSAWESDRGPDDRGDDDDSRGDDGKDERP
jgi:hypothetical protein